MLTNNSHQLIIINSYQIMLTNNRNQIIIINNSYKIMLTNNSHKDNEMFNSFNSNRLSLFMSKVGQMCH